MRRAEIILDISSASPQLRRPLIDGVVAGLLGSGATDTVSIIYDHEPVGLGYELELRRETRGRFDFSAVQRSDGCWVARLTPRSALPE